MEKHYFFYKNEYINEIKSSEHAIKKNNEFLNNLKKKGR